MKKTMKLTLYIALAVAVLLPTSMTAQGLFGRNDETVKTPKETGAFGLMGTPSRGTTHSVGAGNQPFGIEPTAPLGSGVAMLIAAGAGYALLKSKKNKKK